MRQFEYEERDNRYICEIDEELNGIVICSYRGTAARLELPAEIERDGMPWEIRAIGKKAFLGCNGLRSVVLPNTIREIGDWAFSQCGQLLAVTVLDKKNSAVPIEFGTGVFSQCPKLSALAIGVEETHDMAALLAVCTGELVAEDLLKDGELGSDHWYQKWDQRLWNFLRAEDAEGYTDMVLCGEEDIRLNVPEYEAAKRQRKAELCMLRLLHDTLLSDEMRKVCMDYLLTHTKGCVTEEAWQVIILRHGEDLNYYQLFAKVGGITSENIDAMVQDLDAAHAEAKAFLIRYKQEHFAKQDVFDLFSL